ncbi:Hypothetical predicted protein [Mytilus galloprovincialis]|uniref:C2H2-type domain-containing protein n=1 Tax=Mytilus galloprovincialis TaxID=29158 RepID=A0A8B6G8P7_MYTGA|nr:Hypothetical predicted protein [Mytilus galloprovincialis]
MSFLYDAAKAKRRATICLLYTDAPAYVYMGQKHRVVTQILVNHVSVSRTPYYCTLCLFRCTNMDTLKQHVNFHKPHQTLKDSLQAALPDKDYFLIAESPYFPQAGRDFKLLPRQRPGLGTTVRQ